MRWSRLTWPNGNNAFAYEKRKEIESEPWLRIPECKTINSIEEITLWNESVFCESDTTWSVKFFRGLESVYLLENPNHPIYIFDNHNYALYFRAMQRKNDVYNTSPQLWLLPHVIHIDQHSDLWPTPTNTPLPDFVSCTDEQCFDYVVRTCNVGNFINPALDAGIIWSCNWIKNQYGLESFFERWDVCNATLQRLDIDLDFWAPGMGTDLEKTIPLVRRLMSEASLITIATSPYFLEQDRALQLLHLLIG
jgi:hypothetical protein